MRILLLFKAFDRPVSFATSLRSNHH